MVIAPNTCLFSFWQTGRNLFAINTMITLYSICKKHGNLFNFPQTRGARESASRMPEGMEKKKWEMIYKPISEYQ